MVVIQNKNDNHGTYKSVKGFIEKINPKIKVIERERSDHHYPYYSEFLKYLI